MTFEIQSLNTETKLKPAKIVLGFLYLYLCEFYFKHLFERVEIFNVKISKINKHPVNEKGVLEHPSVWNVTGTLTLDKLPFTNNPVTIEWMYEMYLNNHALHDWRKLDLKGILDSTTIIIHPCESLYLKLRGEELPSLTDRINISDGVKEILGLNIDFGPKYGVHNEQRWFLFERIRTKIKEQIESLFNPKKVLGFLDTGFQVKTEISSEKIDKAIQQGIKTGVFDESLLYVQEGADKYLGLTQTPQHNFPGKIKTILEDNTHNLEELFEGVLNANNEPVVVDLGPGNALHSIPVVAYLLEKSKNKGIKYIPVDISLTMIASASKNIQSIIGKEVDIRGLLGDFREIVRLIGDISRIDGEGKIFLFLGTTINNFTHDEQIKILGKIKSVMGKHDVLIVSFGLTKDHNEESKFLVEKMPEQYLTKLDIDFITRLFTYTFHLNDEDLKVNIVSGKLSEKDKGVRIEVEFLNDVVLEYKGVKRNYPKGSKAMVVISTRCTLEEVEDIIYKSGLTQEFIFHNLHTSDKPICVVVATNN